MNKRYSKKNTNKNRSYNRNKKDENEKSFSVYKPRTKRKDDYIKKLITEEPKKTIKKNPVKKEQQAIRLNRYISNSGICSRREADKYIEAGVVEINGKIITELGTKVMPNDIVKFNGKVIKAEPKTYILLNKPKGFVTTVDDPHADKTVMDLVRNACKERIYPIGRLDKNTTGVLLFTNDGEMASKLTHPKFNKKKIYHVFLNKPLTKKDLEQLTEGVELEDGKSWADTASYVDMEDKTQIGIEIHSGKNRVIRRMFGALGYKVVKLDRVYFAGLTKKDVGRGHWRFLTDKEIARLKMGAYE